MSTPLNHNHAMYRDDPRRPGEAALLAWVEGEPLSREEALTVEGLLASGSAEAARARAMRQDRLVLAELAAERAPADLLARLAPAIRADEDARRTGEPARATRRPRLRLVRAERRTLVQTFLKDSFGRRVLAAAAALVVTGVGVYFAASSLSGPGKGVPARHLDGQGGETPIARAPGDARAPSISTMNADAPTTMAAADGRAGVDGIEVATVATPETPWTLEGLVEHERWSREQGIVTPSAAIQLAKQGQLVVRVRASERPIDADAVARELGGSDGWQLVEETPVDLLEVLSAETVAEVASPDRGRLGWPGAVAFVVRSRLDTSTMGALQKELRAKGEVTFEPAGRSLVLDAGRRDRAGEGGDVDGDEWATIPVVVQRR